MTRETLLDVRGLSLSIDTDEGTLEALSDITFTLEKGETFALVGESGCGKSLTAASLMRLLPENARVTAGEIRLDGRELLSLTEREMRGVRGAKIAMVFQESSTALDPVMTVGDQLVEMIRAHRTVSSADAKKEALEWLERVGVSLGGDALSRYPHELSGGQKQRVMIAMALSARPRRRDRRRTDDGARRDAAGADSEVAQRPAEGNGAHAPSHHARPRGRQADGRSSRPHVRGRNRRDRDGCGLLLIPSPPLRGGAVERAPRHGPEKDAPSH